MRNFISLFSFIFLVLLTGCANLNSIHRDNTVSKTRGEIVFTDAKQRGIISNPVKETVVTKTTVVDGKTVSEEKELQRRLRMCSEAAPDVFSAYAFSAAAKVAAKVAEKSGQGEFSLSSAENASTIARTQTINLFREQMFRTCERYLNGAIDGDELVVQAARDQRVMVSILAIEQLTGVYWQPIVALLSASRASTGGPTAETIKIYDEARKAHEAAQTKLKSAKEAEREAKDKITAADLHGKDDCDAVVDPKSGLTDAQKEKCAAYITAQENKKKAEETAKDRKEHYEKVKKLSDQLGGTSTSADGSVEFNPAQANPVCCQNMPEVANAVERIVAKTFAFDEVRMTCVVALRNNDKESPLYKTCLELLKETTYSSALTIAEDAAARERGRSMGIIDKSKRGTILGCIFDDGQKPEEENSNFQKIVDEVDSRLASEKTAERTALNNLRQYAREKNYQGIRTYLPQIQSDLLELMQASTLKICPNH